jgi:hypothetical protein
VDDETDRKMRQVLVQLALTSNGGTLNYEGSSSGGHDQPVPSLGQHDAPHLHFGDLYRRALSPAGRALVLKMAAEELDHIRRSRGDPSREETREERDARIVDHGEGYTVDEVAVWARCSKQAVRVARRDAGREEETGKKPVNGHELGAGLTDEIRRRVDRGTSARQVAKALSLSYSHRAQSARPEGVGAVGIWRSRHGCRHRSASCCSARAPTRSCPLRGR